ncbi:MAG: hypothetical protein WC496_01115 [Phycisphaerae bacterium]|jgi:hypothetical protein
MNCTIKKYLKIVPGTIADYKGLSRFHYRSCKTGAVSAVYKIIDTHPMRGRIEPVIGIIIYSMPACSVQLRNIATKGLFTKLGSATANMQIVNNNIRTIARVVIEPRYRALGLAYELVQKTMPLLNMPYIESLAVMGKVNPFFEKAGMVKFQAAVSPRCVKLRQALSAVGVEESDLVDIERTQYLLRSLDTKAKRFIEKQITDFLTAYGRRAKTLPDSLQRTEFFISRLSARPVYYLWRNADCDLKI